MIKFCGLVFFILGAIGSVINIQDLMIMWIYGTVEETVLYKNLIMSQALGMSIGMGYALWFMPVGMFVLGIILMFMRLPISTRHVK